MAEPLDLFSSVCRVDNGSANDGTVVTQQASADGLGYREEGRRENALEKLAFCVRLYGSVYFI